MLAAKAAKKVFVLTVSTISPVHIVPETSKCRGYIFNLTAFLER
jgi:hypothetical protein